MTQYITDALQNQTANCLKLTIVAVQYVEVGLKVFKVSLTAGTVDLNHSQSPLSSS